MFSAFPAQAVVNDLKLKDGYDCPYYIITDISNQIVTVYDTTDDHVVRQMICSSGKHDATPMGLYYMPALRRSRERQDWYVFPSFTVYAKYASRIVDNFLFHSVLYSEMSDDSLIEYEYEKLGRTASHGCIRLRTEDAKFIAENCFEGTAVYIYEGAERDEDLRELLLERSYTGENGETYNEYLGVSDDPNTLCRFDSGDEVVALQTRLKELGYFSGEIDGKYRTSTVEAVKDSQTALGEEANGQASAEFREELQSASAPVGMNIAVDVGDSGLYVTALQEHLYTLKLYNGEINGEYSSELGEAVRVFRGLYGYSDSTEASPEIQKAISYEAAMVAGLFVDDPDYICSQETDVITSAVVETTSQIRLRSEPNLESEIMDKLDNGAEVIVLDSNVDGGWAKVLYNNIEGYMKRAYLNRTTQTIYKLVYSSASDSTIYTIGDTAENYLNGTPLPKDVFAEYLENGGSPYERAELKHYATVSLGDEGLQLTLLSQPDASAVTETFLTDGTRAEVLEKGRYWSLISGEGFFGYVPNRFLSFWQGTDGLIGEHLHDVSVSEKEKISQAEALGEADEIALISVSGEVAESPTALPIDIKKKT